jgi:hypothetical protein
VTSAWRRVFSARANRDILFVCAAPDREKRAREIRLFSRRISGPQNGDDLSVAELPRRGPAERLSGPKTLNQRQTL